MVQQNPPGDAIGHIVVLVGYDTVRGFKVKSSDENDGKVEWISENRMTWFQSLITEDVYGAVTYDHDLNGRQYFDQNGQIIYFLNRGKVIQSLQTAHQVETSEQLATNFNQRTGILLNDTGFVLKFKKTCQCQGETCEHTLEKAFLERMIVKFV